MGVIERLLPLILTKQFMDQVLREHPWQCEKLDEVLEHVKPHVGSGSG